jgi:acetyl-CoA C-acetyltransferase
MKRAAIVSPLRTAVGKFLGGLKAVPAERPAETIIRAVIGHSCIDPGRIDGVVFAAQVLAVLKGRGWNDPARLNANGSAISLGHPIGATGMRMLVSLIHEMEGHNARIGLETMCIGGGQGMAALFERS